MGKKELLNMLEVLALDVNSVIEGVNNELLRLKLITARIDSLRNCIDKD